MMNEQSVYDELYGDYISGVTGGRADSRQIFENENRNGSIGVNNSLGSNLVPVSALPGYHQMVFKEFEFFNHIQSGCFSSVYQSNENVVVSAPTGSGKTVIFELALLKMHENSKRNAKLQSSKAVYIAPIKALCQEIANSWSEKFKILGWKCVEFTGDSSNVSHFDLLQANIIVTTPEKFDAAVRRWRTLGDLMDQIALILVDEIHSIGETRGGCLEGLITNSQMMRLKKTCITEKESPASCLRILALSATVTNIEDLAQWLHAKAFVYGNEARAVPLEILVNSYIQKSSDYLFDNSLSYKIYDLISALSLGRPTIVFCSSRKGCFTAANILLEEIKRKGNIIPSDSFQRENLMRASVNIQEKNLKKIILHGIGIHSAALCYRDREIIVNLFRSNSIRVLYCTTTLAQGVNLPAHLVVIKGTQYYLQKEGYVDYPRSTVLQMIGRAGRPQFDSSGLAVILTKRKTEKKFRDIASGQIPVESNILNYLLEHINAAISLDLINCKQDAVSWLKSSFFFVRAKKNPGNYGILNEQLERNYLDNFVSECFQKLESKSLMETLNNSDDASKVKSTQFGIVMAKNYIMFETMANLLESKQDFNEEELLNLISKAEEYKSINIRMGEKKLLNDMNSNPKIIYPLRGKVKHICEKIFILLQGKLSNIQIPNWNLANDADHAFVIAQRIIRCITELAFIQNYSSSALAASYQLQRSLYMGTWKQADGILRQLHGIGEKYTSLLQESGINSLKILRLLSSTEIERICERKPPFGASVLSQTKKFPQLSIETYLSNDWKLHVKFLQQNPDFQAKCRIDPCFVFIIGFDRGKVLYSFKKKSRSDKFSHEVNLVIDQNDFQKENSIKVYAIYDSAIGLDVEKTIYCKKETPNESENKIKPSKRSLSAEENPGVKCNELMKATCGHKKKACISQSCKHSCCHRDSKNKILKNSMDSSGKETVHQSCSQKHPVIEESSESDKRNSIVEEIQRFKFAQFSFPKIKRIRTALPESPCYLVPNPEASKKISTSSTEVRDSTKPVQKFQFASLLNDLF